MEGLQSGMGESKQLLFFEEFIVLKWGTYVDDLVAKECRIRQKSGGPIYPQSYDGGVYDRHLDFALHINKYKIES